MTFEVWVAFVVLETLLCLTPGPAVLFVVSTSLGRGVRAGLGGAWGIVACNTVKLRLNEPDTQKSLVHCLLLILFAMPAWSSFHCPIDGCISSTAQTQSFVVGPACRRA